MFIIPENVLDEYEQPTGVIFGDVGTYNYSNIPTQFDTTSHDNLVNWIDLDFIHSYYVRKNSNDPPSPDETVIMQNAGFGMHITYTEHETTEYDTFLDIPYEVREITYDYSTTTWDDLTINDNPTPYERMMLQLATRIVDKNYKTIVNAGLGGDATLDGQVNDSDKTYLNAIINSQTGDVKETYLYIFDDQYNADHTNRDIWQNIYRTYQIFCNLHLSTGMTERYNNADRDVLEAMIDDIYSVVLYPISDAVWAGDNAEFTIELSKAPIDKYVYRWFLNNVAETGYLDADAPEDSKTTITYTKNNTSINDNDSIISVSVYEPITTISTDEEYEDPTKCHKRTYHTNLYVADEQGDILWGDTDNNHIVNIIDAYKILNDYLYKRGDINKDNRVGQEDSSKALAYYSKVSTGVDPEQAAEELSVTLQDIQRGDINSDGRVDGMDSSYILEIGAKLSVGYTESQVEDYMTEKLHKEFHFYPNNVKPRTLGELNALLTIDGVRSTTYNKETGEKILASVKDKNIHLS